MDAIHIHVKVEDMRKFFMHFFSKCQRSDLSKLLKTLQCVAIGSPIQFDCTNVHNKITTTSNTVKMIY